ncbi:hypothetical protein [Lysinibacillus xylanilyticus]
MQAVIQLADEQFMILHHGLMPYVTFAKYDEELSLGWMIVFLKKGAAYF